MEHSKLELYPVASPPTAAEVQVRVAMVEGVGSHANCTTLLLMPSISSGWPLMASNLLLTVAIHCILVFIWMALFGP